MSDRIEGHVARIVTDSELIINRGREHGVRRGMVFVVLDTRTQDVRDPLTGENLGSIPRVKAQVKVYEVADKISLARDQSSAAALSALSQTVSGWRTGGILTGERWASGVEVGDPVQMLVETNG